MRVEKGEFFGKYKAASLNGKKGGRKKEKSLKGSLTVEMSVIVPLLLFMVMQCIFLMFFFHDKNILEGAVYEALSSTVTKEKEAKEVEEGVVLERFYERVEGKCILLSNIHGSVKKEKNAVVLEATAGKFAWRITVRRRWKVLWQEAYIRRAAELMKGLDKIGKE